MSAKKPDPAPAPPPCYFGSNPTTTAHIFTVFVQDDPALVVTFCTRCGIVAEERRP